MVPQRRRALTLYIFLLLVITGITAYQHLKKGGSSNAIVDSLGNGASAEQSSGCQSILNTD